LSWITRMSHFLVSFCWSGTWMTHLYKLNKVWTKHNSDRNEFQKAFLSKPLKNHPEFLTEVLKFKKKTVKVWKILWNNTHRYVDIKRTCTSSRISYKNGLKICNSYNRKPLFRRKNIDIFLKEALPETQSNSYLWCVLYILYEIQKLSIK
jgi:hypothetical protein